MRALMMGFSLFLLVGAAVASLQASPPNDELECGRYELHGKLLRPAAGRYELAFLPGSKGEYRVRLYGVRGEEARDFVGTEVAVKARVTRPFRGSAGAFREAKIEGLTARAKVEKEPVVLERAQDCAKKSP